VWEDRLTPAFAFKAKYPETPLAMFCDAGNGHFNYSDQLITFLGMFIREAAEWRMPDFPRSSRGHEAQTENLRKLEPIDVGGYKLKPVDPRQGWLVDRWRSNQPPTAAAAPYAEYTGDRDQAFWCFDGEMARFMEKCYARQRGKLPQLTGVMQDGKVIPQNPKSFAQVQVKLPPLDASLVFQLQGAFRVCSTICG
jgi:hypothetical protein